MAGRPARLQSDSRCTALRCPAKGDLSPQLVFFLRSQTPGVLVASIRPYQAPSLRPMGQNAPGAKPMPASTPPQITPQRTARPAPPALTVRALDWKPRQRPQAPQEICLQKLVALGVPPVCRLHDSHGRDARATTLETARGRAPSADRNGHCLETAAIVDHRGESSHSSARAKCRVTDEFSRSPNARRAGDVAPNGWHQQLHRQSRRCEQAGAVYGGVFRATWIHNEVRAIGESELRRSPDFDKAGTLEEEHRHGVASRYGVSARGRSAESVQMATRWAPHLRAGHS